MWELIELAGGVAIVLMPLFVLAVPAVVLALLIVLPLAALAAAALLLAAPLLALRSLAR